MINDLSLLRSALITDNPWGGVNDAKAWLDSRRAASQLEVQPIAFDEMDQWFFDSHTGNLMHQSGRFFSIEGMRVNYQRDHQALTWDQPVIVQAEIGILGIITRVVDGVRYFLMQAKSEPGNVSTVQLSPTVQATESNLSQVHLGKKPRYLDYFLDRRKFITLVDQLLSEQGSRFYQKRNRNIIVEVNEDIECYENFCWLTLRQLRELAFFDNAINMDARSVLSCLPPYVKLEQPGELDRILSTIQPLKDLDDFSRSLLLSEQEGGELHKMEDIAGWISRLKNKVRMDIQLVPLKDIRHWIKTGTDIHHENKPLFSVIAVSVKDHSREVTSWNQPLFADPEQGMLGFLTKSIGGVLHFLVQGKFEAGNVDGLEMAPTISCSNIAYKQKSGADIPFLEYFIHPQKEWLRHQSLQSEEGGRFYHLQNRNIILELPASERLEIPDAYQWMTLSQIRSFQKRGFVNIDARTLLSCLSLTTPGSV